MEAVFSSKLYKLSKRKDKIASAIGNPLNTELVLQLKEYLDEPELVKEPVKKVENRSEPLVIPESSDKGFIPPREPRRIPDHAPEIMREEFREEKTEQIPEEPAVEEQNAETEEVVEESVTAAVEVIDVCCKELATDVNLIKGTLNSRDDTKGVSRIFIKNDELWIYYQDKVNLNSVMEPVIYLLNASGYNHLEFNRLARTENAIVFEITCVPQPVEPIIAEE